MSRPLPRRTQQERREETMARLVDATVHCLASKGYHGTTVAAICETADLSQGALFRHFPTRQSLLVRTAREVAERQVTAFVARFGHAGFSPHNIEMALREASLLVMSRENRTWHELTVAAASDPALKEALVPALRLYQRKMVAAMADYFGDQVPEHDLLGLMSIVLHFLDGLAFAAPVHGIGRHTEDAVRILAEMLAGRIRRTDR
jgi:AcrR family transcriptional regulator